MLVSAFQVARTRVGRCMQDLLGQPNTSLLLIAQETVKVWFLADLLEAAGAMLFRYCLAHLQQPEMV